MVRPVSQPGQPTSSNWKKYWPGPQVGRQADRRQPDRETDQVRQTVKPYRQAGRQRRDGQTVKTASVSENTRPTSPASHPAGRQARSDRQSSKSGQTGWTERGTDRHRVPKWAGGRHADR
ncbi:MAG TPA: hypothetical protein VF172_01025 [Nitrososphaera sp.]